MLGDDAGLASIGADLRRLAIDDRRRPEKRAHLSLLQKNADAVGQARDDRILPGDRAGEIEFRRPNREPDGVEHSRRAQAMRCAGGVDQRLRGNAADVEAVSAKLAAFDEDRVEPELAGADRGDIAARAAADDENLAMKLVHFVSAASRVRALSPPRKRGSRRRLRREHRTPRGRCWIPASAGMTLFTGHSSMNSVAGASISV